MGSITTVGVNVAEGRRRTVAVAVGVSVDVAVSVGTAVSVGNGVSVWLGVGEEVGVSVSESARTTAGVGLSPTTGVK